MTLLTNEQARRSHPQKTHTYASRWRWPLACVLLCAFLLRLYGVNFGLPAINDPDELMFELGAVKLLTGPTLNPGWFGHPATTTIYALAIINFGVFAVGFLLGAFPTSEAFASAIYLDPGLIVLPGRLAMALFGVACVFLTYKLAEKLFDLRAGIAAAALLAINPVHIQYSQIVRTDIMATCFLLLCLLAALQILREGGWRATALASFWLAMAAATKWPFAIVALTIASAAALRAAENPSSINKEMRRLVTAGATSVCFLLLISPFLLLDYQTLFEDLRAEAQQHHVGATGGGPFLNAWWYLTTPLLSGFGLLGMALAAGGIAITTRNRAALAILVPVAGGYFLLIVAQNLIWERWALPLMPLLAIPAGAMLIFIVDVVRAKLPRRMAMFAIAAIAAALVIPLGAQILTNARERMNDTRQMASSWLLAHTQRGDAVLVEHFAFDITVAPFRLLFPLGEAGCVDALDLLQGKVTHDTIDLLREDRAVVDIGTLPAARLESCRPDYAVLTHYDRYLEEAPRYEDELSNYRTLLARGKPVATFAPAPGESGGPIVRIIQFTNRGADDAAYSVKPAAL